MLTPPPAPFTPPPSPVRGLWLQRVVSLFLAWAVMQGVAMLLQNHYQRQRLYTRIALGKAGKMDVVWGETAGVKGQLWLLYPLLFVLQVRGTPGVEGVETETPGCASLQAFQFHIGLQLLSVAIYERFEWQVLRQLWVASWSCENQCVGHSLQWCLDDEQVQSSG